MNQQVATQLPPDCVYENGEIVRLNRMQTASGVRIQRRPVAMSLQEARERAADFYDPRRGWIVGGRKLASENFLPHEQEGPALAGKPWDKPDDFEPNEDEDEGQEE